MIRLINEGVYLINGTGIVEAKDAAKTAELKNVKETDAAKGTIAYGILSGHNTSGSAKDLKIRFDKLTSHDITYV